jgi:hypothetical protein
VGAISKCAECQDGAEDRKKMLTSRCCLWYRCVSLEGVIDRPSDEEIATAAQAAADVFLRAYALELPAARKTRKRRSSR